jgi:tetratricopeptide (TPR) repeat protein
LISAVARRPPLAAAALCCALFATTVAAQSPPAGAAPPVRPNVDPFYSSRLREGIAAYERGAYGDAASSLRVACFGMLDAPPELAECLVRLGLAQAAAGDREAFAQTFRRLLEGEEVLGLYSRATLAADLKAAFERRAAEWIPRATLDDSPAFAHLAGGERESELAALPARARRSRLQQLVRDEPREPRWPLLLARFERQERNARGAAEAAEQALALSPGLIEARCLRGWARAELSRWPEAAADLDQCSGSWPELAPAELAVRVELGQWDAARALAGSLTADQRRDPGVARLLRRLERGTPAAGEGVTAGDSTAPAAQPPPAVTPPPASPPGSALTDADATELARLREALTAATSAVEVERVYAGAAVLAARYPTEPVVQHLAAEVAYRASRWRDAVAHFERGGDPGEAQPLLLFYLAVALWESGDTQAAAAVMERCAGRLRPTPFVEAYRRKILAVDHPAS